PSDLHVHQHLDAGGDRSFAELQLANVALAQVDVLCKEEGAHTFDRDQPVREGMLGDLFPAAHLAAGVEQTDEPKLCDGVDEARAANPFWWDVAADHLELDTVAPGDAFDGGVGRTHAASELAALSPRAGWRRGATDPLDR